MFRKYLLIFVMIISMVSLNGCSLFSSDEESSDEATVSESSDESSSEDNSSTDETSVAANNDEEVVDEYPDDDYGGDSSSTTASASSSTEEIPDAPIEGNQEETLFVGSEGTSTESSETSTTTETGESSTPSVSQSSTVTTVQDSTTSESETKTWTPVRKMKKTPYQDSGSLINRLYIARSGDSMGGVANKIYGDSSKSKDLYRWNNHFRGKELNVGDKIYYASARNPADNSQILLYWEEAGVQPQMYSAKKNENFRKVSQNLLGHSRSWMEVWATNDVDSKWDLAAGSQLRYWPDGTAVPVTQAAAQEVPPEPQAPAEEPQAVAQEPAEMGAPSEAGMEEPMGEPPQQVAAVEEVPPPPPPPQEPVAPPPPPPPDMMATDAPPSDGLASMMGGQDDSMMMAVLGGLLILAALILLIFIRRGRKKVKYS